MLANISSGLRKGASLGVFGFLIDKSKVSWSISFIFTLQEFSLSAFVLTVIYIVY
jgi:hypothetical protein